MIKKLISIFLIFSLITPLFGRTLPVRVKDIGKILEVRDNQLLGFGLVVGLRNTGDSRATAFTDIALTNLLNKMGVASGGRNFNSRNVAAVMVTATLPPFAKRGQTISVLVSALGDSTSLSGGTLLLTPLQGPDLNTYAVAQGPLVLGGISERSAAASYQKNQSTVGRIPDGAIVENEVPVTFTDQHNITIVLNDINFVNASRVAESIQQGGFSNARAIDANTIKVPLSDLQSLDLVTALATLEDIEIIPDESSKVVINPRTGTVVIGERVRLFPVAVTHGNITVKITDDAGNAGLEQEGPATEPLVVDEGQSQIVFLNPSSSLESLVNSLNIIGASPNDMISIIQALHEAGALVATIEIL